MKKKIVHIISKLKDGGAQTQLVLLCNGIDKSVFDVYVITCDKTTGIPLSDLVNVIEIPRGNKYNLIAFWVSIVREIKKIKPDIVQAWLPEIFAIPAALAGKILKVPVISSERRIPTEKIGMLWFRDRLKYISHLLANKIISNFPLPITRKSFFNFLTKNKGITIYNGLDIQELAKYKVQKASNDLAGKLHLVYSGRLTEHKRVHLLVESIRLLKNENLTIYLDLYGAGEMKEKLSNLVTEYGLNAFIKFHGYRNDWKSSAAHADCFILPSVREGMPNVLFEAAAIGLPIIATDIEEIRCHFTNNIDALLFSADNYDELLSILRKIIKSPDILARIKQNAEKTIEKYSVQKMVNSYEEIYKDLLKI